jgi:hypothetical protein
MTDDPYAILDPDDTQGLKLDALRYLQMIYRDPALSTAVRMRAAAFAIPYESPKLIATAVMNEGSFAELLDRRLKRFEEMKLIEGKTINGKQVVSEPKLIEEPKPAPPMAPALNRLYNKKLYRRI